MGNKIIKIIVDSGLLLMEFVLLWFFGIVAFSYALTLTDTFSALMIWIGGGICFGALHIIKDLFSQFNTNGKNGR